MLPAGMTRLVHDDCTGEDQDRILALDDVDAIRVGPAEPPLRHGCYRAAAASELVLVIEEVAVRLRTAPSFVRRSSVNRTVTA